MKKAGLTIFALFAALIFSYSQVDLSVTWVSPSETLNCRNVQEEPFIVQIENLGSVAVTGFLIKYLADDDGTMRGKVFEGLLEPGDVAPFSFMLPISIANATSFTIIVEVEVDDDINLANNMVTKTITNAGMILNVVSTDTKCNDKTGAALVNVIGGTAPYQYYWSNGAISATISDLAAGVYEVTVVDAAGCSKTAEAIINDFGGPAVADAKITEPTCYGDANGSIDLTVLGGAQPYEYLWTNGSRTEDLEGLESGGYTFYVRDAAGCVTKRSFFLDQPMEISFTMLVENANCGLEDGAASVEATGGTGELTYIWENGTESKDAADLPAGFTEVTIVDENGCSVTGVTSITEIGAPIIEISDIVPARCDAEDGGIDIAVTGGDGLYTFLWNDGTFTQDMNNVPPGDYTVLVSDGSSGCQAAANFTVPAVEPDSTPVCMLTVNDTLQSNMLIWEEPEVIEEIVGYHVYRSNGQGGYDLLGFVGIADESLFIDTTANTRQKAWRYRITTVDACGNESLLSRSHRSMHLTMDQISFDEIRLTWSNYNGLSFSAYKILRFSDTQGWEEVGQVEPNTDSYNQFTDTDIPFADSIFYVVAIDGQVCISSKKKLITHNIVRSNRTSSTKKSTGIHTYETFGAFGLWPSPNRGVFNITATTRSHEAVKMSIFDIQGREVYRGIIESVNGFIDSEVVLPKVPSGIYNVQLRNGLELLNERFVVTD